MIRIERCEGPLAVPSNAPCSKDMEEVEEFHTVRSITEAELAAHRTLDDPGIWIALNGDVYDVTKFHRIHPGGARSSCSMPVRMPPLCLPLWVILRKPRPWRQSA